MLLGGDEFGRTQRGNNNAYCQDNEISWLDWKQAEVAEGAARCTAFVARLIALAAPHPVLRSPHFLHGQEELAPGIFDIAWFDSVRRTVSQRSWNNPEERRAGRCGAPHATDDGTVSILTLFLNPTAEDRRLPAACRRPCRLAS